METKLKIETLWRIAKSIPPSLYHGDEENYYDEDGLQDDDHRYDEQGMYENYYDDNEDDNDDDVFLPPTWDRVVQPDQSIVRQLTMSLTDCHPMIAD